MLRRLLSNLLHTNGVEFIVRDLDEKTMGKGSCVIETWRSAE